jgi:hypothetical protein
LAQLRPAGAIVEEVVKRDNWTALAPRPNHGRAEPDPFDPVGDVLGRVDRALLLIGPTLTNSERSSLEPALQEFRAPPQNTTRLPDFKAI